jgi:uncharacterized repeat protein (TIGR03806 family)
MRRAIWLCVVLAGCGDDVQSLPDGGPSVDAAPMRAPFGLDTRPSNVSCLAPARPTSQANVAVQPAFPNLSFILPVYITQAPGDPNRFFVVEQGGVVLVFPNDPTVSTTQTFIDITARVTSGGEMGLLGMAFHPNWQQNHQVILSYTAPSATSPANLKSVISRFTSNDGGQTLDPATEQVLLSFDQPYQNHNGGNVQFGPDGMLYIGFGDGGSGGDPLGNGQNINVLFGKILRIDVDNGNPYAIPPTNPFAQGGGRPEIFAWGLRNPWRWSFDRATGELWVGDVGQNSYEEIDRVELGGNYGWNIREGMHCYSDPNCSTAGLIDPLAEYTHADGIAVTGGYVYRGTAIPSLVGTYLYGDYGSGNIWALFFDPMTGMPAPQIIIPAVGFQISSWGEGLDGELYLVNYGGAIHKLVPNGGGGTDNFPQTLAASGCSNTQSLIPYRVNTPLWSDGAGKERYMAVPDGAKIHVNDDGDFDLPVGSVLVKTFSLGGRKVETRLLVHHMDGDWAGYSYEWNDAGTDATLLPAGKTKQVGAQIWYFPSRSECLECHTTAAGRSLGPELAQLNGDFVYTQTGRISNQLATLDHIGMFDAPLPATLPALVAVDSAAPIDARARSYLHANCSICHRPNGTTQAMHDLRYQTPLAMTNTCNVDPRQGDLGITGAKLLVPGMPQLSLISIRPKLLDVHRMPPLATHVVDQMGTTAIDDWIRSITACP